MLQADGGTRTAAITGAWVALHDCLKWMTQRSILRDNPLKDHVAAVSCGVVKGEAVLDLDYAEDSTAETDANFVMTGSGGLVEVQGSAEGAPFSEAELLKMLALARGAIVQLVALQKAATRPKRSPCRPHPQDVMGDRHRHRRGQALGMAFLEHRHDFVAREPARVLELLAVDDDLAARRAGEAADHQR